MSQFLIITSNRLITDSEVQHYMCAAHAATSIEPTKTRVVRCGSTAIVEFVGFRSLLSVEGSDESAKRVTLFDGAAWLERAESFLTLEQATRANWPGIRVHGSYRLIQIEDSGRIVALNDPLQSLPLYFAERKDITAISDRAGILRAALRCTEDDPIPAIWMTALGYMVGNESHTKGVSRLPVGGSLSVTKGTATIVPSPDLWDKNDGRTLKEKFSRFRANVVNALRLVIDEQGEIELGLTGGKDSRLLLALLYEAGLHRRVRFFTSDFAPNHGGTSDVRVARMLAKKFELNLKIIPTRSPSDKPIDSESFFKKLSVHTGLTNGLVGFWDEMKAGRGTRKRAVSGMYGEALKHFEYCPIGFSPTLDVAHIKELDALKAMQPEALALMKAHAKREVRRYCDHAFEANDLRDVFYITQRLPNWAGINFATKRLTQGLFLPFYNRDLLSLPFAVSIKDREAMRYHYEIISGVSEEMAMVPFADDQWSSRLCAPATPIASPSGIPRHGSWQNAINTSPAIRRQTLEMLEDPFAVWWTWVDRPKLLDLLSSPKSLTQRQIIALFGLLVAAEWNRSEYPIAKISFDAGVA